MPEEEKNEYRYQVWVNITEGINKENLVAWSLTHFIRMLVRKMPRQAVLTWKTAGVKSPHF